MNKPRWFHYNYYGSRGIDLNRVRAVLETGVRYAIIFGGREIGTVHQGMERNDIERLARAMWP